MLNPSTSLESRIQQALDIIPPAHRLPPQDDEFFLRLKKKKPGYKTTPLHKELH